MSAEIIAFPYAPVVHRPDGFRKALVAVSVLMEFGAGDILQILSEWVERGLLSEDEAAALCDFYRRGYGAQTED